MDINYLKLQNIQALYGVKGQSVQKESPKSDADFQSILNKKAGSLSFSRHAVKRMEERGVGMDTELMNDLEHAVEDARKKGARELAVIGAKGVFIINVPNNTVITTMTQEDMKEKIVTNIDSAVLM